MTLVPAALAAGGVSAASGSPVELLRVVLSLVAVIAMILVIAWFTRRAQSRTRPTGKHLRCIESLSVGAKERVLLLQVGDEQVVVGASPSGLRTLMVLDEPLPPSRAASSATPEDGAPPGLAQSFRTVLAQWGRRR